MVEIGLLRIRILRTRVGRIYVVHLARQVSFILKDFFRKLYANPAAIPPDSFAGYQAGAGTAGSFEHLWNIASFVDERPEAHLNRFAWGGIGSGTFAMGRA